MTDSIDADDLSLYEDFTIEQAIERMYGLYDHRHDGYIGIRQDELASLRADAESLRKIRHDFSNGNYESFELGAEAFDELYQRIHKGTDKEVG